MNTFSDCHKPHTFAYLWLESRRMKDFLEYVQLNNCKRNELHAMFKCV